MSAFIFNDQVKPDAVHQAELLAGIKSKAALLGALSIALRFPDYFGGNWDALWECICDLSWLPSGDVTFRHKDLPLAEDHASLSTYLSILQDGIEKWNATGSNLIFASPDKWDAAGGRELLVHRKFLVMFPPDTQSTVERLLLGAEKSSDSWGNSRS